jgi:hypothetical protein
VTVPGRRSPSILALAVIVVAVGCSPGNPPPATGDPAVDALVAAARELLERRTSALVQGAVPEPPDHPLAAGAARASAAVVSHEQAAIRALTERREALRQAGEAYTGATIVLTLERATVSETQIDLAVSELTTLAYKKVTGGEPDVTAFKTEREFHFARDAEGWVLVAHGLANPAGPAPINEP